MKPTHRAADGLCCLPSQTVGPFFHFGLTTNAAQGRLAGAQVQGEHIRLRFTLLDGEGVPVPDGMLELWQADAVGRYNPPDFCGFGRLATDWEGKCTFETIRPGRVPDGEGGCQAAHISVSVFARGLLGRLCTRVYFAGDPALAEDPVLALVPEGRRPTLLARWHAEAGVWEFEIHLQGENETVFFDV